MVTKQDPSFIPIQMVSASHPTERLYYRPSEVVRATGLAKATVFEALWSGNLKGYRVGKAWLIPAAALQKWIEQGDDNAA